MTTRHFDIAVIGAGVAGASASAFLSADRRVALIEAEDAAGYHTTGRSAAMWIETYGPPDVRSLTRLSRPFFEAPSAGFAATPLIRPRPVLLVATPDQCPDLDAAIAEGPGLQRRAVARAEAMVPALRPGYLGGAALEDAFDLDVAAIHQGFLRMLRSSGGVLALRSRTGRIERHGGKWDVETVSGDVFTAPVVVNAAGAWGDEVGRLAGAAPLGLEPRRRTVSFIRPGARRCLELADRAGRERTLVGAAGGARPAAGLERRSAPNPAKTSPTCRRPCASPAAPRSASTRSTALHMS